MKGHTRHTLLLIGAPKQALALGASARPVRPLHRSATKLPDVTMIDLQRLDIVDRETAEAVLQLQQVAYRIEAELIGSDGIPPLWETIEDLRTCGEEFLGVTVNGALVGAISWRYSAGTIDIHRLVVDPEHFRRGIATALVRGALEIEPTAKRAIVQTGAQNAPAAALYLREGFEQIEKLDLGGVHVSRFAKRLR